MNTFEILMQVSKATVISATNKDAETALFLNELGEKLMMQFHDEYDYQEQAKQAWVMTYSGKHFHAFDPKTDDICLKDIAHALSKNNRFTGHSVKNYTVGEHSLHCYELLRDMGCDRETCLIGLLHDASEAYLQDIASPFKKFLPDYKAVEKIVQDAVYMKYLGYVPTNDEYSDIKLVDEILLVNEIEQLMPEDEDWTIPDVPHVYVNVEKNYPQYYVSYKYEELANILGAHD